MVGVDRVALEIIGALAQREDIDQLVVLHPPGEICQTDWLQGLNPSDRSKIDLRPVGRGNGHQWEQTFLSRAETDLPLVSLCGTGPIVRRNHTVYLHDAQVWDVPSSYSRAFRIAYRTMIPALARTARTLVTVSAFARSRLESLRIAPVGKAVVIPNGADHMLRITPDDAVFERLAIVPDGYILAIGSLAPHKNLDLLLEAARGRRPDSPPLVVAGAGNRRVFSAVELTDRPGVRVIGRVSDAELKALYQRALALAFPSLTEGFGLPPVEAMLLGCPVVATSAGAVPEVCGDAALFADPLRVDEWTAALTRIADDEPLRNDLRTRGLQRASRYTWAASAALLSFQLTLP